MFKARLYKNKKHKRNFGTNFSFHNKCQHCSSNSIVLRVYAVYVRFIVCKIAISWGRGWSTVRGAVTAAKVVKVKESLLWDQTQTGCTRRIRPDLRIVHFTARLNIWKKIGRVRKSLRYMLFWQIIIHRLVFVVFGFH